MNKLPGVRPDPAVAAAARRANGAKSRGRPKGAMSPAKKSMIEDARSAHPLAIKRLMYLAVHGENHAVQLGACRELLDRGYGRPFQAVGVDGGGGPQIINVITGVHRRDDEAVVRDPLEGLPPRYPPPPPRPIMPDGRDPFAPPCPVRLIEGPPPRLP